MLVQQHTRVSVSEQAISNFGRFFEVEAQPLAVSASGRVNLIGEHIDYHNLPVLPIAIQKRITIAFLPREDRHVRAISQQTNTLVEFSLDSEFTSQPPGEWGNYLRAAAAAIQGRYQVTNGIDSYIASDLPSAAGLSSSSALLVAFSLALLKANGNETTFKELTDLLPDGEQLVGTRGGAMDHVAILASQAGNATLIRSFSPLEVDYIPVPPNWRFLIAHSLVQAEKSGTMRAEYNARRAAGTRALEQLGFDSYREAVSNFKDDFGDKIADEAERNAFLHVISEARRVEKGTAALREGELRRFGSILCQSHASLRDRLRVSLPEVDALVDSALQAGSYGARLTGAGFGGCIVCVCTTENVELVRERLITSYYAGRPGFDASKHIFVAEPSAGALSPQPLDDADEY